MVCEKCEEKLAGVITADPWKAGASNTVESGRVKLGGNRLLKKRRGNRYTPLRSKCKYCKGKINQPGAKYCTTCAYKRGKCAMCGKGIVKDIKSRKQSTV